MKKNINKLLLSFATLALIMGCNEDDDNAVQPVSYSPVTVTVSSTENNVTVMENAIAGGMASYTITASISEPSELHYIVNLEQTGGTAERGQDFDFDDQIIISPGLTSGSATINVYASGDIETSDDTFTVSASSGDSYSSLASPFSFSGTITDDYINDVLSMTIDWSGDFTYTAGVPAEVTIDFCDMDLDLLVYDSSFTDTGIYDAATGSCPEHIDLSGLADGTYYLVLNVYDNPFADLGAGAAIPVTITYAQDQIINETAIVNNSITSDTASGTNVLAIELEVVDGYIYTLTPQ